MTEATETTATLTDEQIAEAFPGQDINHIRSMMGKMDGDTSETAEDTSSTEAEDVVYPDYIPEKFRSGTVEEAHAKLAESYKNLESKLGAKPDAKAAEEGSESATEEDSEDSTAQGTLSFQSVEEEYLKNGEISEETYAAFEAKGLARDTLDGYIAGKQAIANQIVTRVYNEVGGAEQYEAMVKWADKNWSEEEVEAFDRIVAGPESAAIMVAVRGLKASYQSAEGVDPVLAQGTAGNVPAGGAYQSLQEMTTDMKNPKYKTDPAFRKMVEKKIEKSNIW